VLGGVDCGWELHLQSTTTIRDVLSRPLKSVIDDTWIVETDMFVFGEDCFDELMRNQKPAFGNPDVT